MDEARGFWIDNEVAESVIAKLDNVTLAAKISIVNRRSIFMERDELPNRSGLNGDASNSSS
ncbi:hypothetical protein WS96_03180 [Burkholderia sp. MSMB1835]|nr:hypothetical protein WS96_03180 [Burkholderia sp. MSMB1835]